MQLVHICAKVAPQNVVNQFKDQLPTQKGTIIKRPPRIPKGVPFAKSIKMGERAPKPVSPEPNAQNVVNKALKSHNQKKEDGLWCFDEVEYLNLRVKALGPDDETTGLKTVILSPGNLTGFVHSNIIPKLGAVYKCRYMKGMFLPVRPRDDKLFPNTKQVLEDVNTLIQDPIHETFWRKMNMNKDVQYISSAVSNVKNIDLYTKQIQAQLLKKVSPNQSVVQSNKILTIGKSLPKPKKFMFMTHKASNSLFSSEKVLSEFMSQIANKGVSPDGYLTLSVLNGKSMYKKLENLKFGERHYISKYIWVQKCTHARKYSKLNLFGEAFILSKPNEKGMNEQSLHYFSSHSELMKQAKNAGFNLVSRQQLGDKSGTLAKHTNLYVFKKSEKITNFPIMKINKNSNVENTNSPYIPTSPKMPSAFNSVKVKAATKIQAHARGMRNRNEIERQIFEYQSRAIPLVEKLEAAFEGYKVRRNIRFGKEVAKHWNAFSKLQAKVKGKQQRKKFEQQKKLMELDKAMKTFHKNVMEQVKLVPKQKAAKIIQDAQRSRKAYMLFKKQMDESLSKSASPKINTSSAKSNAPIHSGTPISNKNRINIPALNSNMLASENTEEFDDYRIDAFAEKISDILKPMLKKINEIYKASDSKNFPKVFKEIQPELKIQFGYATQSKFDTQIDEVVYNEIFRILSSNAQKIKTKEYTIHEYSFATNANKKTYGGNTITVEKKTDGKISDVYRSEFSNIQVLPTTSNIDLKMVIDSKYTISRKKFEEPKSNAEIVSVKRHDIFTNGSDVYYRLYEKIGKDKTTYNVDIEYIPHKDKLPGMTVLTILNQIVQFIPARAQKNTFQKKNVIIQPNVPIGYGAKRGVPVELRNMREYTTILYQNGVKKMEIALGNLNVDSGKVLQYASTLWKRLIGIERNSGGILKGRSNDLMLAGCVYIAIQHNGLSIKKDLVRKAFDLKREKDLQDGIVEVMKYTNYNMNSKRNTDLLPQIRKLVEDIPILKLQFNKKFGDLESIFKSIASDSKAACKGVDPVKILGSICVAMFGAEKSDVAKSLNILPQSMTDCINKLRKRLNANVNMNSNANASNAKPNAGAFSISPVTVSSMTIGVGEAEVKYKSTEPGKIVLKSGNLSKSHIKWLLQWLYEHDIDSLRKLKNFRNINSGLKISRNIRHGRTFPLNQLMSALRNQYNKDESFDFILDELDVLNKINLMELYKNFNPDKYFWSVRLSDESQKNLPAKTFQKRNAPNVVSTIKKSNTRTFDTFQNRIQIRVDMPGDKTYDVKLFATGKYQITGCVSQTKCKVLANALLTRINDVTGAITKSQRSLYYSKTKKLTSDEFTSMKIYNINAHFKTNIVFKTSNKNTIGLNPLFDIIKKDYSSNLASNLNPKLKKHAPLYKGMPDTREGKRIIMKLKSPNIEGEIITLQMHVSGAVNVSAKSMADVKYAHSYVKTMYSRHRNTIHNPNAMQNIKNTKNAKNSKNTAKKNKSKVTKTNVNSNTKPKRGRPRKNATQTQKKCKDGEYLNYDKDHELKCYKITKLGKKKSCPKERLPIKQANGNMKCPAKFPHGPSNMTSGASCCYSKL